MAKKVSGSGRRKSSGRSEVMYYNTSTGRLSGREVKAQKRLNALVAKYRAEGLSEADAKERARKEMRDNTRGDWRA